MTRPASLQAAAALLLVLATIVVLAGITAERSVAGETAETRQAESAAATSNEVSENPSSEGAENHDEDAEAEEANEASSVPVASEPEGEEAEEHADEASETILGVNPESSGTVAAAVVISLLLAAALWFWGTPAIVVIAAGFALLFTALDVREVLHQINESRGGLAAVALVAAALHVAVAITAGLALARRNSRSFPA